MISTKFYDGGTELAVNRTEAIPGMDRAVYLQQDFEEDLFQSRRYEIDALYRDVNPMTIAPWPEKMPGKMWVDVYPSYSHASDGMNFNLYHHDQVHDDYPPLPAGEATYIEDPDEMSDLASARLTRSLSWEEMQERAETPTEWLRLDSNNERYGTRLRDPLTLRVIGNRGKSIVLEMPDNSLFAPFDLRKPERYTVFADGSDEAMSDQEGLKWLRLHNSGVYRIYLRPRRWRWYVTVVAYYLYATAWQTAIIPETFLKAWYDRPPVYPYRHAILTSPEEDYACFWTFEHSRAAGVLRSQIMGAQWYTMCEAYAFLRNDPAKMTLWRDPQRSGEFVLGIGRYDQATGKESRVWVRQDADLDTEYPRTQLAYFPEVPFLAIGV